MTDQALLVGSAFVFGLLIGSFLNVCIARLPEEESVVTPGSRCPSCHTAIRWFDNVPLLSYAVLGGRCRTCRTSISWRYPLVEFTTAALFALQVWWLPADPILIGHHLLFTALLVVLFGTDYDVQRLPDVITLPGIIAGVALSVWVAPGPLASVLGAISGAAILLLVRWSWKRLTGIDGMGLGDVKMLAMIGAFLGWRQVGVVLFLASLAGAIIGVALAATGRKSLQARLPFGTFLAVAAYAASLVGEPLLGWYLSMY
jgi:leader peptidase (prepilin peptidase)/N-methyltransferase